MDTSAVPTVKTSDIYLASYLRALDIRLVTAEIAQTEQTRGFKRVTFVFALSTDAYDKHKAEYFNGTGTVSALKYTQVLRSMKSLCQATVDSNGKLMPSR